MSIKRNWDKKLNKEPVPSLSQYSKLEAKKAQSTELRHSRKAGVVYSFTQLHALVDCDN